jgi:endonuclease G
MNARPLLSDRLFSVIIVAATVAFLVKNLLAGADRLEANALNWSEIAVPRTIALAPGIIYEPDPSTGAAAWVAELVTAESINGDEDRPTSFRVDPYVLMSQRARDDDYRANGFDRGHGAAAANHADNIRATFSLANVWPQLPEVNRGPMKQLEEALRRRVDGHTSLVIVTAPLYELDGPKRLCGRLPVPTGFVKAVLVLSDGQPAEGVAFRVENARRAGIELLSIDNVEDLLQRDLFAFLPDDVERELEAAGG